jgi:thiamine-phosphate pyrophosphorylase
LPAPFIPDRCRLYGILDLGYVTTRDAPAMAGAMCRGGVDILQLRAKNLDVLEIEVLGQEVVQICDDYGVPFIVNDYPELVPSIGATGAHVGQSDLAIEDARWRAGRALAGEVPLPIVGKSTHSLSQAVAAAEAGADYIGFGPLFATPTKPDYTPIGIADIREVHRLVAIPIFCIGGIKLANLNEVIKAGAQRVVVVSGILQAPDPEAYCRELKALLPA